MGVPAFFVFSLPLLSLYLHPCTSSLVLRRDPSCSPSSLSPLLCPTRCRVNFLPLLDIARASPSSFFVPCSVPACSETTPTPYFFPNFFVASLSGPFVPHIFLFLARSCARTPMRAAKQHEEERRAGQFSYRLGAFYGAWRARRACSLSSKCLHWNLFDNTK